jgi:hypothetical protein
MSGVYFSIKVSSVHYFIRMSGVHYSIKVFGVQFYTKINFCKGTLEEFDSKLLRHDGKAIIRISP